MRSAGIYQTNAEEAEAEAFLELVGEYMEGGMSQDDAEIKAQNTLDEEAEMRMMDAAEERMEEW